MRHLHLRTGGVRHASTCHSIRWCGPQNAMRIHVRRCGSGTSNHTRQHLSINSTSSSAVLTAEIPTYLSQLCAQKRRSQLHAALADAPLTTARCRLPLVGGRTITEDSNETGTTSGNINVSRSKCMVGLESLDSLFC